MSPGRVCNTVMEDATTEPHMHKQTLARRRLTTGLSILLDPTQTAVLMPPPQF